MKKLFAVRHQDLDIDLVLLLLRLLVGVAFIYHGSVLAQHPFSWMGPNASIPPFFQGLATLSQFGGGFALIFGFLTRLSALGLFCTMAVAVWMHVFVMHDPFVASGMGKGSFEPAANYLVSSLLLMILGPGRISLDKLIFGVKY